ncbi:MAG: tRNA pseudouridine(55) synthase TruB [Balneolaceae bacterium]
MAKTPIPLARLPVLDNASSFFPGNDVFREGLVIPVDKPVGWSSFDVVRYIRNRIPVKKVGHAGTLDPLATGLLILCCGRATKSISQIQEQRKTYIAEIMFGAATPSFDAATPITEKASWTHLNRELIDGAVKKSFIGELDQVPPVYSALWKDGQRMYKLARKGIAVEPEPRRVVIHDIEITEVRLPSITLEVRCGKGCYIRSLANDLAKEVGTVGYLSGLRRTEIGHFSVDKAWGTDQFNAWSGNG